MNRTTRNLYGATEYVQLPRLFIALLLLSVPARPDAVADQAGFARAVVHTDHNASRTLIASAERSGPEQSSGLDRGTTSLETESQAAGKKDPMEEAVARLKQSASVRKLAHRIGTSPNAAYHICGYINFALLAGFVYWPMRTWLPAVFRSRTNAIRMAIEEARRTSEDAQRRRSELEDRLAHLQSKIDEMESSAQTRMRSDEEAVLAKAEEDKRRIDEMVRDQINHVRQEAQRELKAFVATLAVSLAAQELRVDLQTDERLVSSFVNHLQQGSKTDENRSESKLSMGAQSSD